jgi:hypothetical protein
MRETDKNSISSAFMMAQMRPPEQANESTESKRNPIDTLTPHRV